MAAQTITAHDINALTGRTYPEFDIGAAIAARAAGQPARRVTSSIAATVRPWRSSAG